MTSLDHSSDFGGGGTESVVSKSKCNVPGKESQAPSSLQRSPRCQTQNILLNLWILHRSCFPLLPIASQLPVSLAFCGSLVVKNLTAMQETQVWSLGQEDSLEKRMATHSSILAWRILMDRGAWWATVHRVSKESDMTMWLWLSHFNLPTIQSPL